MKRNSIDLLLSLLFLIVASGSTAFHAWGQNPKSVVGKWTLKAVSDPTGRNIEFRMEGDQLAGDYVTSKGERKAIRNAKFNRGSFNFDVPDLKLRFEMRSVRDGLMEGRMTAYSTTEKRPPQPVKMVKKK